MVDSVLAHVGNRIHLYRKNIGMSMEELALKIHKSKASVSKYESGQIAVDVETLFHIAQALHVAPHHLLDYAPPAPAGPPLSTETMAVDGALRALLTIGPEAFREMKRGNKLFVPTQ